MATFHPDDLIKSIKRDSLRVRQPSKVVFLCGGKLGEPQAHPLVLRDAYYRIVTDSPPDYKVMLAEDADPLTADALYEDLLSFESDIAQVVGLIVLFVESAGSLAEFGAFSALRTVAPRLLAIVNDHYYNEKSFIRDGPIRFLESKYGDEWVLSLETSYLGISGGNEPLKALDMIRLHDSVAPVIIQRLDAQAATEKFVKEKDGHTILMITGLCQFYGALNQREIRRYLGALGNISIDQKRLHNFLYCSELLGWIRKIKKGNNTYYAATGGEQALDFSFEDNVEQRDKLRWRNDIRAFWKTNDHPRSHAISDVFGGVQE